MFMDLVIVVFVIGVYLKCEFDFLCYFFRVWCLLVVSVMGKIIK